MKNRTLVAILIIVAAVLSLIGVMVERGKKYEADMNVAVTSYITQNGPEAKMVKITIFDEPFSGLDPVQMKLLENVMVEFHKKEKGIYIISSHDIECLQNVCDKCLLLHNGQIREINTEEVDREKIAKILSEGE